MTEPSSREQDGTGTSSVVPLIALCLGFFLVNFDVTVVSVAIPQIGADLGAGLTSLQWVADGYTLVFAALLLNAGSLGDRLGGKRVFLSGLVVFAVASLGCGLAPAPGVLIGARLVLGVGAAMMVPTSLSLLRAVYSRREERARAFGVWSVVAGAAGGSGPVVAGLLVAYSTWRVVFLINVPIVALALWLGLRNIPSQRPPGGRGIDWRGQVLSALSLALLVGTLNEAGSRGWTDALVLAGFALAAVSAAAFVQSQRRTANPTISPGLVRQRSFSAAAVVGFVFNFGYFGLLFAVPIYFERVLGFSTLATALAVVPMAAPPVVLAFVAGRWVGARGSRAPGVFGLLTAGVGIALLLWTGPGTPYVWFLAPLFLAGIAPSFTMPASTAAIMETAPAEHAGQASGVFNMSRQVGSAVGVALFGSFLSADLVDGMHTVVAVTTGAFVVGALLACFAFPGHDAEPGGTEATGTEATETEASDTTDTAGRSA